MVSKDQTIGGVICLVCVLLALFYVVTLFYPEWLVNLGWASDVGAIRFWLVAIPVFIAFLAIMLIGAWIGWTMATTPPPKPIEEMAPEAEEKKEETTPTPAVEETTEEKKPAKKAKIEK
jgi:hypothetical protein